MAHAPRARARRSTIACCDFSAELKERGLLTISQSLKTDAAGVRVTKQGEKSMVRDGPFAEAKEMIGGFFLLTCATREQAIEHRA